MPEHVKLLHNASRDDSKIAKPILVEYQIEEFEQKMHLAMEFSYQLIIKTWDAGFFEEYKGWIHRIDPITKMLFLEI